MSINLQMRAVLVLGLVLVGGCLAGRPEWSMALSNQGAKEIVDSTIKCGRFYYSAGILPPNIFKGYYCDHEAIPPMATVRWVRVGEPWQTRVIDLRPVVPAGFSGCIYFQIDDQDRVVVYPKAETAR